MHAVAIVSALLSAFWAAVGIVVRQRATQRVPGDEAMSAAMATTLVRQPLWWAGTFAAVAGYAFQAAALAHGSLLLVQPLLVSSLLPSVIASVIAARRAAGRVRASLLGVAVAILLGMIAVVTKVCTHRYSVGGWHALMTVPAPYVLVGLAVTVTVVQNSAFHAGALQASVPIMLVGEPVVAVLLGVVVLGEHLAVGGLTALILVIAVVAMAAATAALGRSQAIENVPREQLPRSPDLDEATLAGVGARGRPPGARDR